MTIVTDYKPCRRCGFESADYELDCSTSEESVDCRMCGYSEAVERIEDTDGTVKWKHTVTEGSGALFYRAHDGGAFVARYLSLDDDLHRAESWLRNELQAGGVQANSAYLTRWNVEAQAVEFVIDRSTSFHPTRARERGDQKQMGSCPTCAGKPCKATDERFGTCPVCHTNAGYLNLGNDHWFVCNEHKTKWVVGANLFSSSMDETEEQQKAEQEEIGFADYKVVEPHYGVDPEYGFCECFRCANDDVRFNDPKMMGAELQDGIIDFIAGYPYTGLRWICRKLGLTPAEALKQILPNITLVENCCWEPEQVRESLISEVESLTAVGWEPGVRPEPPTPEHLRDIVWDHFKPELRMLMDISVADLVYRSGSNFQDVIACMVDVAVGNTPRAL